MITFLLLYYESKGVNPIILVDDSSDQPVKLNDESDDNDLQLHWKDFSGGVEGVNLNHPSLSAPYCSDAFCKCSSNALQKQCKYSANTVHCRANAVQMHCKYKCKYMWCMYSANTVQMQCKCIAKAVQMRCKCSANADCVANAVQIQWKCCANAVSTRCKCSANTVKTLMCASCRQALSLDIGWWRISVHNKGSAIDELRLQCQSAARATLSASGIFTGQTNLSCHIGLSLQILIYICTATVHNNLSGYRSS